MDVRLFAERPSEVVEKGDLPDNFVMPGDLLSHDTLFVRSHNTYVKDKKLYAAVAGRQQKISKLHSVTPMKYRYAGEAGDVVVGRVKEVQQRRWLVDVNARLDAVLNLTAVHFPGAERRRKTEEDELNMDKYLKRGDLVCCEISSVYHDGTLCLNMRTDKHKKLEEGVLIRVPASLILRTKTHFHNIIPDVEFILSRNGNIWITPSINFDTLDDNFECDLKSELRAVARVRNCIVALAQRNISMNETVVLYAYEASSKFHQVKDLLEPSAIKSICDEVVQRLNMEGGQSF